MKKETHTQNKTFKLVFTSLMIALTLVLNRIIPATPVYHLTLDFIPIFITGTLFGPIWAAVTYGVADTLGCIIYPFGPYNPGITLALMIIGLAYAFILYKKDLSGNKLIIRAIISSIALLLIKMFITTFFLWIQYGGGDTYWAYFIMRIPNCVPIAIANAILLPPVYRLLVKQIQKYNLM